MAFANGRGRLIYGCMGLGGPWDGTSYGATEIDQAAAVIEAARGIGVELFDHADIYRSGKSEAVFGEVLARSQGLRGNIKLQTKCGIRLGSAGWIRTTTSAGKPSLNGSTGA